MARSKQADPVNRSQAIRDYLKTCKTKESKYPSAVVEGLAAQGVEVSAGLVSQVKATTGKKSRKSKSSPAATTPSYSELLQAKALLETVGGDQTAAKKALEAVAKIRS